MPKSPKRKLYVNWNKTFDLLKGKDPSLSGASGAPAASSPHQYSLDGPRRRVQMHRQPVQSGIESVSTHVDNAANTLKHNNLLRVDNKPISPTNPYPNTHEGVRNRVSIAGAGETHVLADGTKVQRHAEYHKPTNTFVVSHSSVDKGKAPEAPYEGRHPQHLTFHGEDRHYHGPHQIYHGGKLAEHTHIADNKKHGPFYKWHKNGKLLVARNFKDGVQVGQTDPISWYKKGDTLADTAAHRGDLTLEHPSKHAALKTPEMGLSSKRRKDIKRFKAHTSKRMGKSITSWNETFDLLKGHDCVGCKKCNGKHAGKKHSHKEKHHGNNAYMMKQNLHNIAENAAELHEVLDDEHDVPKWADTKAAVAADKVNTLNRYLSYKTKRGHMSKGITSWFDSSDTISKSNCEDACDLLKGFGPIMPIPEERDDDDVVKKAEATQRPPAPEQRQVRRPVTTSAPQPTAQRPGKVEHKVTVRPPVRRTTQPRPTVTTGRNVKIGRMPPQQEGESTTDYRARVRAMKRKMERQMRRRSNPAVPGRR